MQVLEVVFKRDFY